MRINLRKSTPLHRKANRASRHVCTVAQGRVATCLTVSSVSSRVFSGQSLGKRRSGQARAKAVAACEVMLYLLVTPQKQAPTYRQTCCCLLEVNNDVKPFTQISKQASQSSQFSLE